MKALAFALVLLTVGAVVFIFSRSPAPSPTSLPTTPFTSSRYVPYSPDIFASTADTRRVLFFYSSWCTTCSPAEASFSNNTDKIPSDVTVIRVNFSDSDTDDAEKELAQKYQVLYQHTFIQLDSHGNKFASWNGGDINTLLANLK